MNQPLLDTFRERLCAGDATLRSEIQSAVVAHRVERGAHREWGLLCEEAGLMAPAFSEFQLALRDDLDDPLAAFHLRSTTASAATRAAPWHSWNGFSSANRCEDWLQVFVEILCDDGAEPRARQAIDRALAQGLPASTAERLRRLAGRPSARIAEPPAREQELVPGDADCVRFHRLFSGREVVRANGSGRTARAATCRYTSRSLPPSCANYLLGTFTIGVYPIRLDGTATFFALDLDIDKHALQRAAWRSPIAQQLRDILRVEGPRLLGVLRGLGFAPLFENSGYKGRHFWVFLEEPETAGVLHLFGKLLLAWQTPHIPAGLHLEYFPKQANLKGKGLGNLIKLPLGIHRCTGRRSELLDDQSQPLREPLIVLRLVVPSVRTALCRHRAVEGPQCGIGSPRSHRLLCATSGSRTGGDRRAVAGAATAGAGVDRGRFRDRSASAAPAGRVRRARRVETHRG